MPDVLAYLPGIVVVTFCYSARCYASPFGTCRKCGGWGAKVRATRCTGRLRRGRECRRCEGYGRRLRMGRRACNLVSRLHREGTR
ncbi:hypothetical protein ACFYVL_28195 [Streptomyces sp. NPDC004111]|uniref:hypothetical protein n=1 Tax=Streptomyces sp. NPDC004111 TaxID=3364690 RepID=UPI0036AE6043